MTEPVEVLLAEDNASDAELVLHSLAERVGVRVYRVWDGQEALDFLWSRGAYAARPALPLPRVIFLDIKLPKLDGFQVLSELRRHPRTRDLPVVLLTSSMVTRDVIRGYQLGANSYVQKPMEFTRFRELVRRLGDYWLTINESPPPAIDLREP